MDNKERIAYLEALMYISTSNEKVEKEELIYLDQVAEMYGIEAKEVEQIKDTIINKEKNIEEILKEIKTRTSKLSLVYELLTICYIDGNYDILEKQSMENICNILGIEEGKLEKIEKLIIRNIELQKDIKAVLEME